MQDSLDPAEGLNFLDNEAKESKKPSFKKILLKKPKTRRTRANSEIRKEI